MSLPDGPRTSTSRHNRLMHRAVIATTGTKIADEYARQTIGALLDTIDEKGAEIEALKAKVVRLLQAGDALHAHSMNHELDAAWTAAKAPREEGKS